MSRTRPQCGTIAATTDALLDAVREARGRRAIRPADTVERAAREIEGFLVVPEWYAGERAADVAADVLRSVHQLDAAEAPLVWMLYAEGARRLGFAGPVPVPLVSATARQATA